MTRSHSDLLFLTTYILTPCNRYLKHGFKDGTRCTEGVNLLYSVVSFLRCLVSFGSISFLDVLGALEAFYKHKHNC